MKSCHFIISPNIRSKVGKQGSAKAYSADFYRNGSYFLQYTKNITKRVFCNDLHARLWGVFIVFHFFLQTMHRNNFMAKRKKKQRRLLRCPGYGTSWIDGHSRFTRCGVCDIFTHDVMLVPRSCRRSWHAHRLL